MAPRVVLFPVYDDDSRIVYSTILPYGGYVVLEAVNEIAWPAGPATGSVGGATHDGKLAPCTTPPVMCIRATCPLHRVLQRARAYALHGRTR